MKQELAFDKHFVNSDEIYRLTVDKQTTFGESKSASVPASWAPFISEAVNEVESYTRILSSKQMVGLRDNQYNFLQEILTVDSTFFKVFKFKFSNGTSKLSDPQSIVISESLAKKLFNSVNPLGKTIFLDDDPDGYIITGVFVDLPQQTHFNSDVIRSFNAWDRNNALNSWKDLNTSKGSVYSYIQLNKNSGRSSPLISSSISRALESKIKMEDFELSLQELSNIHLYSDRENEIKKGGNIKYLYLLGVVNLILIVIAVMNFTSLSTLSAMERLKEFV